MCNVTDTVKGNIQYYVDKSGSWHYDFDNKYALKEILTHFHNALLKHHQYQLLYQ